MHEVWGKLLDEDFVAAYKHGFVMAYHDGIAQQVLPTHFYLLCGIPREVSLLNVYVMSNIY
jgi:hypothetical protein